ncbi:hypothetical protein [uncultured Kordia sp.]|uniref:hypothetical protein n=1 Tax=uncultured Kordia sp. TaxID=507699 RepID=UPI002610A279|nr:hypothetical protein [uncultured Kordia sp.]
MKKIITCIFFLQSLFLCSQNNKEIEADYEMQGYFKNYQEFNLDSLQKKKFTYIRDINSTNGGFEFERKLDEGLKQSIYTITIDYPSGKYMKYKEYKVYVFSKKDTIIGLINYDTYRKKTNSYFDYEKLSLYVKQHNEFYKTTLEISDFVDQLKQMEIYGYSCGYSPVANALLEHRDLYFDDLKNAEYFREWLTSFNPELQAYGLDALEHLEENEQLPLSPLEKKIIKYIKTRNTTLLQCGGCVIFPDKIYKEIKTKK